MECWYNRDRPIAKILESNVHEITDVRLGALDYAVEAYVRRGQANVPACNLADVRVD
jgi:hypothetical protein